MSPIVYILDDDEGLRESLSWLVESRDIRTASFSAAAEFLAKFDANLPACLILDVRMPNMNGLEVQRILNQQDCYLPIIFVSGHGDIPMSVRAIKDGAIDFLEKPYDSKTILGLVEKAIGMAIQHSRLRTERSRLNDRLSSLSSRQLEIFQKMIERRSSKVIAQALGISSKTVDIHKYNIRTKLGPVVVEDVIAEIMEKHAGIIPFC